MKQGDGYILPVLMDNAPIPADLLHPHIHYLRAKDHTPEELAEQLAAKVRQATGSGQQPMAVGDVVQHALTVRLPKLVPDTWSKYHELDVLFDHLGQRFSEGAEQLRLRNILCTVRRSADHIAVRVERTGRTIAGLDIRKGTQLSDDQITWSVGINSGSGGFNGWAKPIFDKNQGTSAVEVNDLANFGTHGRVQGSYEQFFAHLWDKVVEQVEQASRD